MRLLNFTIIKLTAFLIIGIIIGYFFLDTFKLAVVLTLILLIPFIVLQLLTRKPIKRFIWQGVLTYLLFISLGILSVSTHNQKNFKNHYSNIISGQNDTLISATLRIREVLKPGNYYDKYVVDILGVNDKVAQGKSLLNIKKDSSFSALKVDEVFIAPVSFKELINPLNPYQFDYKNYLKKQYIYHQIFTTKNNLYRLDPERTTIFGIADQIRNHINSKLDNYGFKPAELAIINALLMGQRQDITKEIYSDYANAGAIHILAVSGLHVGIILLILTVILKPIEQFKNGRIIKMLLIISFLWCFAIIAGLSASVTRAVTMFSIVTMALNLKRPTNIYNTLAISMLIILLVKPLFLFDVGFQLSYLAVIAIVAIDPLLYKLWQPKLWLTDKLWHTLTITISAQFGIIPVSLYYFHQFPSLFFVSNLVIIPFLGIILGLGLLVIFTAVIGILPQFLADLYGDIIRNMNQFVGWVSDQDSFLFRDISFNIFYVITSYLLIFSFIRLIIKRNFNRLLLFLISILLVQTSVIGTKYMQPKNEFIIFHKSRYTLIGNTSNNQLEISHNLDSLAELSANKIIQNYTIGRHVHKTEKISIKPLYILKDKKLLIVDSLGIYNVQSFNPEYILLRESPQINLNRLIDSLNPTQIIADGSNYKSYVEHWRLICAKRKIPFHNTSKKGAFILNY